MCHAYQAWYAWELGCPDTALSIARAGVSLARASGHPFSIGVALAFHACVHLFRREFEHAATIASESIDVCEEPGFRTWLAWAKVLRGRALSQDPSQRQAGISEINDGLRLWDASEAVVTRPFALAYLAEAYSLGGDAEQALKHIREADTMLTRHGERYFEAEIKRLYGQILLNTESRGARANRKAEDPEELFREAIDFARARDMASSMLGAAVDLSRLIYGQGRGAAAIEILEDAIASFGPARAKVGQLNTVSGTSDRRPSSVSLQDDGSTAALMSAQALLEEMRRGAPISVH
jgi:tetratricopeptide (TPR) repeat protein